MGGKVKSGSRARKVRSGPRLPNSLRKELDRNMPVVNDVNGGGMFEDDDDIHNDFYEYEEALPEEDSKKNRRYDPVENYEFELPENFEDSNVESDDDDDDVDDDPNRHSRMLENITGLPADAFGGKKKKEIIISEAYPESEFNPCSDILDGDGRISIHDLLDPLRGKSNFSKLKKDISRWEKKSIPTVAPVPQTVKDSVERSAVNEKLKKDITRFENQVKRNREAPTLFFDEKQELGKSSIGAIASEFEPRLDFEKKMASLVGQTEVVEAHKRDGARLLELNEVSIEDVKERRERLAKMRELLFHHELKAKRVKKIKSKTYHRLLKKDKAKAAASIHMDPEAAKEHAIKLERKRVEERMTLKHKNSSKWAKRILKRGLDVQDDATKTAFSDQLNQHASLTRKINSMKESSGSDDSSDDDSDDTSAGSDQEVAAKVIKKAKEKTLKVLEGDQELPTSGVLSLPFMVRGMKKRKEAADEEARQALEEYDQFGDNNKSRSQDKDVQGGRRMFGVPEKVVTKKRKKEPVNNYYGNSDSESDAEANEEDIDQTGGSPKEQDIDPALLREEFGYSHDSVFKSCDDAEDAEPKATYEVSYLSSDSWKKVRQSSAAVKGIEDIQNIHKIGTAQQPEQDPESEEDNDEGSDTDSGGEMVDGILSGGPKPTYELPSQAELIQRAFAGDDVEEDFAKEKEAMLDEENPEPEKPVLLPGWGQWTTVQNKRGLPSWMVKEHEIAKQKRAESLKKRKDAHLKNVVISEKIGKKAEKLHTKTLPYPYTSKEVFEQSIRMPIGPEFNPVSTIGALNRPEVVKKAGIIIKPIEYEDLNVHARAGEGHKRTGKQGKSKKRSRSMVAT